MTPPAKRQAEIERLRAIHTPPLCWHLPACDSIRDHVLRVEAAATSVCDYCDDGDAPVDGWHLVPDPEGIEGTARIPCARA